MSSRDHSLGTDHTHVRKVGSYILGICRCRPACSSVMRGVPSKESVPFNSNSCSSGRPREVHDFLMKIVTEVPEQGEHKLPHEPPASRTIGRNPGWVQSSFPGHVERIRIHEVDHRYGAPPTEVASDQ